MSHRNALAAITSSTMKRFRANRARDAYRSAVRDRVAAGDHVPPAEMDAYVCALLLSRTESNRSIVQARQAEPDVHAAFRDSREDNAGRVSHGPSANLIGASSIQLHHGKRNQESLTDTRSALYAACEHAEQHSRGQVILDFEVSDPASELAAT